MFGSLYRENSLEKNPEGITHALGFDGKRWYTGSYAQSPEDFLHLTTREDVIHYARDQTNSRTPSRMHGFVSTEPGTLESIPFLDKEGLRKLHEEHVIPIWDKYGAQPITTAFGTPEGMKAVSELIPPEALAHLQEAQRSGTPTFITFDPATQQWQNRTSDRLFQKAVAPIAEAVAHTPPAAAESTAEQATQKAGNGLLQALYHEGALTGKGKMAVAATVLATVGVTAAWFVYSHKAKSASLGITQQSAKQKWAERVSGEPANMSVSAALG